MEKFTLKLNLFQMGIMRLVDWVGIKRYSIDGVGKVTSTFVIEQSINNLDTGLRLAPTDASSMYQIQVKGLGQLLLAGYFEMPNRDAALSELKVANSTRFPPISSFVSWGDISGNITDQLDLITAIGSGSGLPGKDGAPGIDGKDGVDGKDGFDTGKAYATYALMVADKANIPANTGIQVIADTELLSGFYTYDGVNFTKSTIDLVAQANAYTDSKFDTVINATGFTRYLTVAKLGLTTLPNLNKTVATLADFHSAHANVVAINQAIADGLADGATKFAYEAGVIIPVCYVAKAGAINTTIEGSIKLRGTPDNPIENIEIINNGAILHVIFDTNLKNPYDLSSLAAWDSPGAIYETENVRNITFTGGFWRGDQYSRTGYVNMQLVNGKLVDIGESLTEQTYGIFCHKNSRDIKFKGVTATGFRGDGVSGSPNGHLVATLEKWTKGAFQRETSGSILEGTPIAMAGAYKSAMIDITTAPLIAGSAKRIIDNRVQLNTTGYVRRAEFRSDYFDVVFYDATGAFISWERGLQADDITLPYNCKSLQFFVYEDERTLEEVSYGGGFVKLYTGSSADFLFDDNCEFYENHRGAVSNLGSRTTIRKTKAYDIGFSKLGFLRYYHPTNYAFNFEDTYCTSLVIDDCDVKNVPQAILMASATLNVSNSRFSNCKLTGVFPFAVAETIISNNVFNNVGGAFNVFSAAGIYCDKIVKVNGNVYRDCLSYYDISQFPKWIADISGNTFIGGLVSFSDNGLGSFNDNRLYEIYSKKPYPLVLKGFATVSNNQFFFRKKTRDYVFNHSIHIDAKESRGNVLHFIEKTTATSSDFFFQKPVNLSGFKIVDNQYILMLTTLESKKDAETGADKWLGHTDTLNLKRVDLDNGVLALGQASGVQHYETKLTIDKMTTEKLSYIHLNKKEKSALESSPTTIIIKNSSFDVTDVATLIVNNHELYKPCVINMINCTFTSDTVKTIQLMTGNLTNVTVNVINPTLNLVTLAGTNLVIT